MSKKLWVIDRFFGGQSESAKEGSKGSFLYGDRLDLRTDLNALGVNVKTTKDSGTVVTDLPKWIEHDAVNDKTYAYGDDGNFYSETAGTWSALTTPSTAVGQGMRIWNDYVWIRKTTAVATYGPLSGAAALTQSHATVTGNIQSITDHAPIVEFLGNLYFANSRFLGEWDGTTWTYNKITLPVGWKIRTMAVLGEDLVMGGWIGTNVYDYEKGFLWFWNGTDTSVTNFLEVNEGGVNAMKVTDNALYFVAGAVSNLYVYTGQVIKMRQLTLDLTASQYVDIFPGAMDSHRGNLIIGMAGKTDSSTLVQGLYSYGRTSKNYPRALNLDHIISTNTTTGTTLKIGAVNSVGPNELYIGWEDTTAINGIDKVSGTSTYSTAIWHSLWFDDGDPYVEKETDLIKFTFKPLAANETIDFYYRRDRASSWTTLGTASTDDDTEIRFPITPMTKWKEIQVRADLKTSGTTSPKLLSAIVSFSTRKFF